MQAWMVVHALINGYGRTQPGCRDDLLAFLFQLSYCKVRAASGPLVWRQACMPVPRCSSSATPRMLSWGVTPLCCVDVHLRSTQLHADGIAAVIRWLPILVFVSLTNPSQFTDYLV